MSDEKLLIGHGRGVNGHDINGPSASQIAAAALAQQRSRILETFITQYLADTGATIENTVLCQQYDMETGVMRHWCEPKDKQ